MLVTCPPVLDLPVDGGLPANVRYVGPALQGPGDPGGWRKTAIDTFVGPVPGESATASRA